MVLAVDVGNTNIVLGVFSGEELITSFRVSSEKRRTADEYVVTFYGVLTLAGIDPQGIDGVVLSSVVPPLTQAVDEALARLCSAAPMVVGPGIRTGFQIRIDNPAQLGSDMVANVAGALGSYSGPLLIVDMGTATTMTAVDGTGMVLGASIAPGLVLSLDALCANAAQLPDIRFGRVHSVIGRNTEESIRSGTLLGAAAMVDGMILRFAREMGVEPTVLLTGGNAQLVHPHCLQKTILDENLLLKGLVRLYERNHR